MKALGVGITELECTGLVTIQTGLAGKHDVPSSMATGAWYCLFSKNI